MIRRDVSGYSDTVFEGRRPRSTHFELDDHPEDHIHAGCVTPIRSFLKSFWDDPGTDNYKLHTRPPMPDTACPESVELYKKANALLYNRDELIGNITRADDELGAKEDALKREDERCRLLQEYLTNRRLKREQTAQLSP